MQVLDYLFPLLPDKQAVIYHFTLKVQTVKNFKQSSKIIQGVISYSMSFPY